jgi:hypothetical protein
MQILSFIYFLQSSHMVVRGRVKAAFLTALCNSVVVYIDFLYYLRKTLWPVNGGNPLFGGRKFLLHNGGMDSFSQGTCLTDGNLSRMDRVVRSTRTVQHVVGQPRKAKSQISCQYLCFWKTKDFICIS